MTRARTYEIHDEWIDVSPLIATMNETRAALLQLLHTLDKAPYMSLKQAEELARLIPHVRAMMTLLPEVLPSLG